MSRNASSHSLRETVPTAPKPIHDLTPGLGADSVTIALDNLPASLCRLADQLDIASSHNDSLSATLTSLGGHEYVETFQPERSEYNTGALGYLQYLASLLEYQNGRRGNLIRALGELI